MLMALTKPQKVFCAVEYAKTMSVITVQRNFRRQFDVDPPDKNSIKRWHTQLMETGCLCKNKSIGRPRSEETVDRVRQSFVRSRVTKGAHIESLLQWLGHLERIGENRIPLKVHKAKIYSVRRKGRPRTRWMDDVMEDIRIMIIRGWRERRLESDREGGQGSHRAVAPYSR
ncbi:hypothetical protein C0J52_17269 [Blattella germanica]|nr:hypothetical protein C0J52_17269 [Blattella germanica]